MRKSSFNICIVDFGISFNVYIVLALLIKFSLNDIGYKCLINKNLINKSSRNIVLGAQFFKISESKKLPKDTIIFNTEGFAFTKALIVPWTAGGGEPDNNYHTFSDKILLKLLKVNFKTL